MPIVHTVPKSRKRQIELKSSSSSSTIFCYNVTIVKFHISASRLISVIRTQNCNSRAVHASPPIKVSKASLSVLFCSSPSKLITTKQWLPCPAESTARDCLTQPYTSRGEHDGLWRARKNVLLWIPLGVESMVSGISSRCQPSTAFWIAHLPIFTLTEQFHLIHLSDGWMPKLTSVRIQNKCPPNCTIVAHSTC